MSSETKEIKVNKGTGAGGANTNKNGLPYEELTDLKTEYSLIEENKHSKNINFVNSNKLFITTKKGDFFKCLKQNDIIIDYNKREGTVTILEKKIEVVLNMAHGCKNPDECFIDKDNKRIFIIEKKFQQVSGSVCEKIQTPKFKVWQYNRLLPKYKIVYMYCLSEWFKENCKAELEYLKEEKIPVFWGNDNEYKNKLVNFLINYK